MAIIEINVGMGLAPCVSIIDGKVFLVWGTEQGVEVRVFSLNGQEIGHKRLPHGFFNSFPITQGGP